MCSKIINFANILEKWTRMNKFSFAQTLLSIDENTKATIYNIFLLTQEIITFIVHLADKIMTK